MAAATASLNDKSLLPDRRKFIADLRDDVTAFLTSKGYPPVPSVSNKFMLDVKRPNAEVIAALRQQNVSVGRPWPVWPTHIRISIGTPEEMQLFKTAFAKVMG